MIVLKRISDLCTAVTVCNHIDHNTDEAKKAYALLKEAYTNYENAVFSQRLGENEKAHQTQE